MRTIRKPPDTTNPGNLVAGSHSNQGATSSMSTALQGRIAIRARQVKPGEAYAVEVKAGQLVQITDVSGKQVADFVAFNAANHLEHLSVSATRTVSNSIMIQKGMQLVTNRRTPMFELVDDSVGRHDMLLALCDRPESTLAPPPSSEPTPVSAEAASTEDDLNEAPAPDGEESVAATGEADDADETDAVISNPTPEDPKSESGEPAGCLTALARALDSYGIDPDQIPDPVNWFMNVGIKGRGELEVREPLSERNDYVVLAAVMDSVIAVTACSQTDDATNGETPTDILVRVYR